MSYLVVHPIRHGLASGQVKEYAPGDKFTASEVEDVSPLLESGALVKDDAEGRAHARAIAQSRETVKRPYGLL